LYKRKDHYLKNYGVQPHFKAGAHSGTVTVTEIGKYKKEIAYHGDPVNTAARIQGQCNRLGAELLISNELKKHVESGFFKLEPAGSVLLRGKQKAVEIFSVSRPST
jgi:adenylate cyclase